MRRVWWDEQGNLLTERDDGQPRYVMVQFEKPLMEKVAEIICAGGGDILNVGFGCGLVDSAIQRYGIASHTIVEAHPAVYARMLQEGWGERENVTIIHKPWQDVGWSSYHGHFDGVFWDPYPFTDDQTSRLDSKIWYRLITRLVKPHTGIFVIYGVHGSREAATATVSQVRGRVAVEYATCEVHVPFAVDEWTHLGVGSHEVHIPSFRVLESYDAG